MKRRDLLTAAVAAPVLAAAPAVAQTQLSGFGADSPLRALYHQWQAAIRAYNASGLDDEDPQEKALFDAIIECEERAEAFVPETAADYAFKIIFADDDGGMDVSRAQEALVRQAYRMVGITPRLQAEAEARALVGEV